MAEIVELRLERGLTELLELEKSGLFTSEEVKAIVNTRENFEYKLQRMVRSKEDYLKYITYEMSLLQLLRMRRKKMSGSSENSGLAKNAERAISKRIAAIYRSLIYKYPSDVSLWLSFIDFCKTMAWRGTASGLYDQMLRRHPHLDYLWIAAAKFEAEDNLSIDPARQLLQRGLRFNEKSSLLWREYFKLEVIYVDKIYLRRSILTNGDSAERLDEAGPSSIDELDAASTDAILSGEIAKIVFESAQKATGDVNIGLEMMKIVEESKCPEMKAVSRELLNRLLQLYPTNESIVSHSIISKAQEAVSASSCSGEICQSIMREYEEAITAIPTEAMWNEYLKFQLQVVSSCLNVTTRRKFVVKLDESFERGHSLNVLSFEMKREWLSLHRAILNGSSTKSKQENWRRMDQVLLALTENVDVTTPSLWLSCLQSIINTSGFTNDYIHRFYKRAMDKIHRQYLTSSSSQSLANMDESEIDCIYYLVKLYLEWSIDLLTHKRILTIIETLVNGVTLTTGTSNGALLNCKLKMLLIHLANRLNGVSCALEYFVKYHDVPPISRELYDEMLAIVTGSDYERQVIELYVSQEVLSKKNVDIWLKYIHILMKENDMKNVPAVYRRACNLLDPCDVNQLSQKYALLKLHNYSDN